MSANTQVYVIDTDREVRMALVRWARDRGCSARPFLTAADFLEQLADLEAGILFIDIGNSGDDGFGVIEAVARTRLACPIIAMAESSDTARAVTALKRGAVDFLLKPIPPGALHEAVAAAEQILDRRRLVFEQAERDRAALERLSRREREVLDGLADGLTSKRMAEQFHVSARTIEAHRAALMAKLDVDTTAEAIAIFVRYRTALLAHASRITDALAV